MTDAVVLLARASRPESVTSTSTKLTVAGDVPPPTVSKVPSGIA